jgi:hypothetical protein
MKAPWPRFYVPPVAGERAAQTGCVVCVDTCKHHRAAVDALHHPVWVERVRELYPVHWSTQDGLWACAACAGCDGGGMFRYHLFVPPDVAADVKRRLRDARPTVHECAAVALPRAMPMHAFMARVRELAGTTVVVDAVACRTHGMDVHALHAVKLSGSLTAYTFHNTHRWETWRTFHGVRVAVREGVFVTRHGVEFAAVLAARLWAERRAPIPVVVPVVDDAAAMAFVHVGNVVVVTEQSQFCGPAPLTAAVLQGAAVVLFTDSMAEWVCARHSPVRARHVQWNDGIYVAGAAPAPWLRGFRAPLFWVARHPDTVHAARPVASRAEFLHGNTATPAEVLAGPHGHWMLHLATLVHEGGPD